MTEAQWLFEYHALRKKEERELEVQVEALKTNARVLRDTLVGVLGLDVFVSEKEKAAAPPDAPVFYPASLLFSNHHLLKGVLDEQNKAADSERALKDEAFEEFSKKLARGEVGDMDPLLLGNLPGGGNVTDYWAQESAKQMLHQLGVKPRPANAPAVPHFSGRPRKSGGGVSLEGSDRLLQEGADAIPVPLDRVGPAPIPLPSDALHGVQIVELEPGVFGGDE